MNHRISKPVMDSNPWPLGQGFNGANAWWQYVLNQTEAQRLDHAMILALLNTEVRQRLLAHDTELLEAFNISYLTRSWLQTIHATSLEEYATAILRHRQHEA